LDIRSEESNVDSRIQLQLEEHVDNVVAVDHRHLWQPKFLGPRASLSG